MKRAPRDAAAGAATGAWNTDPAISAQWAPAAERFRYGDGPWGRGVRFFEQKK